MEEEVMGVCDGPEGFQGLTDYLRSSGLHLLYQVLPASSAAWAPSSVLAIAPLWAS